MANNAQFAKQKADYDNFIEQKKNEIRDLTKDLEPYLEKPKCEWKLSLMRDIHSAAEEIKASCSKLLYELMEWPNAEHSHEDGFYEGSHNVAPAFKRPKDWFERQGFTKYKTTYTYANSWDKLPLTVAFYVPNTVQKGEKSPIMWFFHGGGFCTGANDHVPWFSLASIQNAHANRAIIIAPDYPLGPEANYVDIVESIIDFLHFYKYNRCFEPKYEGKNWEEWLLNLMPTKGVLIDTKSVLVEGESAGGNAAIVALFLNADRKSGTKIPIRAALLRYPMLAHYKRKFGASDPIHYMGIDYQKAQLQVQVQLILAERDRLEAMGCLSTRGNSSAPKNMAPAMLMSVTEKWETSFKRAKPGQSTTDPFVNKDCIERARESVGVIDADLLPAMYIYHGGADTNCPVKDTAEFVDVLRSNYPAAYAGDGLVLDILQLMKHGFDYDIAKTEAFVELAYTFLNKHWLGVGV